MTTSNSPPLRRGLSALGVVTSLVGVALFAWFVQRVGAAEIWGGLRQVGWGLALIVAIGGLRFLARAAAWRVCLEPPYRLSLRNAFLAVVSGDAFGNLTPLGPLVGEPAKAAFVREGVPLAPALTALAVENLIYTFTVAGMIATAMLALLFSFELPGSLRQASEAAVAAILAALALALVILWRRPRIVSRALAALAPRDSAIHARLDRVRALEHEVYTFAARRRRTLVPLLACELGFHALGVLEVHLTWWMMQGAPPPLLTSFILEGANRLITVVFKFVPLQFGVAELGTGAFTTLLGYGPAPGATLAIVRKTRIIVWTTVGTLLFVRRGLRTHP
ncbi:MAG TPA: lysylphosphatidylglycerol synthase domain-containing protein [Vicinamibacterales bacterium]|nr:lysylphosphatidylglycerol synthase domain-containing protein [Vicinamibacterales bacterium]